MNYEQIITLAEYFIFLATLIGLSKIYLDHKLKNNLSQYNTEIDLDNQNPLFKNGILIRRTGMFSAITISSMAIFLNLGFLNFDASNWGTVFVQASLILILLKLSLFVVDKIIFGSVINDMEIIVNDNNAIPIVEAFYLLGTGLILFSSIYGNGPDWTIIFFFIIGQALFILTVFLYEFYINKTLLKHSNINLRDSILANNNISSIIAMRLSFFIFISSIFVAVSIFGDYTNIKNDMQFMFSTLTFMFLLLFLYISIVEKLIFNVKNIGEYFDKGIYPTFLVLGTRVAIFISSSIIYLYNS